jgi:hypothetical protein
MQIHKLFVIQLGPPLSYTAIIACSSGQRQA